MSQTAMYANRLDYQRKIEGCAAYKVQHTAEKTHGNTIGAVKNNVSECTPWLAKSHSQNLFY